METVSSVKKRQRGLPLWASMAVVTVVLGGGATWFFWPRLHPGTVATAPGDVQQSAMGDMGGFDPTTDGLKPGAAVDSLASRNAAADSVRTLAVAKDTTATQKPADPAPAKAPDVAVVTPPATPEKVETTPAAADTVAKTTRTTIKPKPRGEADKPFRQGYLLINCEPNAQVYINGIYRGDAAPTLRLTLPVGLLSIECRANGHESYLESMRVTPDEMSQRTITLREEMGIISLATTEGAEFYVDGELMGVTPIMHPINVAAGSHTLMLKKDGYFTWTSNATVTANGTLPLHITLSQRY